MGTGTSLEVRGGTVTVDEQINRGRVSDVFRAHYDVSGRELVVKVARSRAAAEAVADHAQERDALERLTRAGVGGVLPLIDSGTIGAEPYLVLPHIDGMTLRHLLAQRGKVPIGAACVFGCQILRTLVGVHANGLVHCDIKPSNILLEYSQRGYNLWIVDFGISEPDSSPTRSSSPLRGTPHYMSPEQLLHDPVGSWTDLFALGVVLYESVTGRRPYSGDDMISAAKAKLYDDVLPADVVEPECPRALAELIGQLLAREPALRPASARVGLALLEKIAHEVRARQMRISSVPPRQSSNTEVSTVSFVIPP